MFDNNRVGSNAPILTGASLTEAVDLVHTAYNFVWGRDATLATPFTYEGVYHLLLSNTGTQNVWVGNKTGVKGVLLNPGASLNLSVGREAQVWVRLDVGANQDLGAILFR